MEPDLGSGTSTTTNLGSSYTLEVPGAKAEFEGRFGGIMTVIAVAGATGGVGKTIVERLVQEPKYQVIVLSRSFRQSAHIRS